MENIEFARQCGSYKPGHEVHWIQARQAAQDDDNPPVVATLIECCGDGLVTVDWAGTTHHLWHHEPGRLARLAARNDNEVAYQARWSLLRTRSRDGWFTFSVCSDDHHAGCPTGPPTGDLLDQLEERGGFTIPADMVESELARLERQDDNHWAAAMVVSGTWSPAMGDAWLEEQRVGGTVTTPPTRD